MHSRDRTLTAAAIALLGASLAAACARGTNSIGANGPYPEPALGPVLDIRAAVKPHSVLILVLDAYKNGPIEGAQLELPRIKRAVASDARGVARIDSLETGAYTIRALRIGYKTRTDTIQITDSAGAFLVMQLRESRVSLVPLAVSGRD